MRYICVSHAISLLSPLSCAIVCRHESEKSTDNSTLLRMLTYYKFLNFKLFKGNSKEWKNAIIKSYYPPNSWTGHYYYNINDGDTDSTLQWTQNKQSDIVIKSSTLLQILRLDRFLKVAFPRSALALWTRQSTGQDSAAALHVSTR